MIENALISSEPHPSIPLEDRIFEPFLGAWDLQVTWYAEDGSVARQEAGEWCFDRVLEGRGIQDVWIVPPRDQRPTSADLYEYGTSIRFYDPSLRAWHSTWIGPMHRIVRTFIARHEGDTVVLETDSGQSEALRWVFSDITSDAFTWRNTANRDGTWQLQQDFQATSRLV